jgi:hypothetical protein
VVLAQNLNETTTAFENSLSALGDHVPESVFLVLVAASLLGAFALGRGQAFDGPRHVVSSLSFVTMVALVVFVTLDLEQPRRGLVVVSQASLERLFDSLGR